MHGFLQCKRVKIRVELLIDYGLNLTIVGYILLGGCLNHFVHRIRANQNNTGKACEFWDEFGTVKKPGKKMRSALVKVRKKPFVVSSLPSTMTFLLLTSMGYPEDKFYSLLISLWNTSGLVSSL